MNRRYIGRVPPDAHALPGGRYVVSHPPQLQYAMAYDVTFLTLSRVTPR